MSGLRPPTAHAGTYRRAPQGHPGRLRLWRHAARRRHRRGLPSPQGRQPPQEPPYGVHLAALGLRWVPVVNPARALALPLTLQGGAVVQHALTTGLGSVNCGKDEEGRRRLHHAGYPSMCSNRVKKHIGGHRQAQTSTPGGSRMGAWCASRTHGCVPGLVATTPPLHAVGATTGAHKEG